MPAPQEPDYYAILQVEATADAAAIRAAHRKRARDLHPDVNPSPDATARMAELNHARDILLDPARRAEFDRTRQAAFARNSGFNGFARARTARPAPSETRPERMRFTFGNRKPGWKQEDITERPHRGGPGDEKHWRFDAKAGPEQEDWYAFLGLGPWASSEEVRNACAALASQATYPGLSPEALERRRAKLAMAAATLAKGEARAAYDATRPPWNPPPGLPDYYALLGLKPSAGSDAIAEAVTRATRELPPKLWNNALRERERQLRQAWWVLRDPTRRTAYDRARRGRGEAT